MKEKKGKPFLYPFFSKEIKRKNLFLFNENFPRNLKANFWIRANDKEKKSL